MYFINVFSISQVKVANAPKLPYLMHTHTCHLDRYPTSGTLACFDNQLAFSCTNNGSAWPEIAALHAFGLCEDTARRACLGRQILNNEVMIFEATSHPERALTTDPGRV